MAGAEMDPEGVEVATLDRFVSLTAKRVLEIGCGDGRLTWHLAERARHVLAIDPDRRAIASARRSLPRRLASRVRFEVERADRMHIPDGTIDAVIFSWSL